MQIFIISLVFFKTTLRLLSSSDLSLGLPVQEQLQRRRRHKRGRTDQASDTRWAAPVHTHRTPVRAPPAGRSTRCSHKVPGNRAACHSLAAALPSRQGSHHLSNTASRKSAVDNSSIKDQKYKHQHNIKSNTVVS